MSRYPVKKPTNLLYLRVLNAVACSPSTVTEERLRGFYDGYRHAAGWRDRLGCPAGADKGEYENGFACGGQAAKTDYAKEQQPNTPKDAP